MHFEVNPPDETINRATANIIYIEFGSTQSSVDGIANTTFPAVLNTKEERQHSTKLTMHDGLVIVLRVSL